MLAKEDVYLAPHGVTCFDFWSPWLILEPGKYYRLPPHTRTRLFLFFSFFPKDFDPAFGRREFRRWNWLKRWDRFVVLRCQFIEIKKLGLCLGWVFVLEKEMPGSNWIGCVWFEHCRNKPAFYGGRYVLIIIKVVRWCVL